MREYGLSGFEAEEAVSLVGLGQTGSSIALSTPQIIGGVLTTGIATSTAGAGAAAGTGTFLGLTAAAIPIIGAVVAGVTLGLMALFGRKGPRQKVATTQIVDKVEPLLQQNLAGYMAGPHTVSSQVQALNNFDAGWQYVVDNCGIPEMGDPGERCISERQAGGVWDWFARYRTPIVQDPNVKPDPLVDAATGKLIDSLTGGVFGGAGSGTLLLAIALVAGAFLIGGGK
jgi:hypothetical protein